MSNAEAEGRPERSLAGSIGLAVYPGDAEDAEHLVKQADRDMYSRKSSKGRA